MENFLGEITSLLIKERICSNREQIVSLMSRLAKKWSFLRRRPMGYFTEVVSLEKFVQVFFNFHKQL